MNAIDVKNLTKKYGVHFAVKDLSFHVRKGTVFGLLGANGAGKENGYRASQHTGNGPDKRANKSV